MEKIKEYKGIIILVLIVLSAAFYWYEWRPTSIVKKCYEESVTSPLNNGSKERLVFFYKNCLKMNGLEK